MTEYKRARKIDSAEFTSAPIFPEKKHTAAQKKGLKYEDRIKGELSSRYGKEFLAGPWIRYVSGRRSRVCQPDGILHIAGRTIVVEIKLSHRPEAEDKLRNLYQRVVQKVYPDQEILCAQICRNIRAGDRAEGLSNIVSLTGPYTLIHCPR